MIEVSESDVVLCGKMSVRLRKGLQKCYGLSTGLPTWGQVKNLVAGDLTGLKNCGYSTWLELERLRAGHHIVPAQWPNNAVEIVRKAAAEVSSRYPADVFVGPSADARAARMARMACESMLTLVEQWVQNEGTGGSREPGEG